MVNRIWPTAVAGETDSVSYVSALACHIGGPNSVNPGQILLVYGNHTWANGRLKVDALRKKTFRWNGFLFFDEQAVLFTSHVLSASLMKPVGQEIGCTHIH